MAQAQWIWVYALQPRTNLLHNQPTPVESHWLDYQKPLTPTDRDALLNFYTRPSWNIAGTQLPPKWTHAWWTAYDTVTGSFGPWQRHIPT
jgi:hypothetical protein